MQVAIPSPKPNREHLRGAPVEAAGIMWCTPLHRLAVGGIFANDEGKMIMSHGSCVQGMGACDAAVTQLRHIRQPHANCFFLLLCTR